MQTTWGRYGQFSLEKLKVSLMARTIAVGECLEWTGCMGSHGRYGSVGFRGKTWLAHRLAYTVFCADIPDGLNVCHRCDNGRCINPAHLFLGTQEDNVLDMEHKRRSRHPAGEDHGRAKLTWDQVRSIRREHAAGASGRSLARKYSIDKVNIAGIVKRKTWAIVTT